ncbi:hypothetical protein IV417_10625 [Alphaproteobacteria bacterium KMM 3653]|uniref:LPS-assembly lipoprotein n=1 Tax=Harenicola maris TaxID=2841044 RepID=A0AAP2CQH6_9RHOB|nr:hypothetical protein [Harenicola maris]
MWLSDRRGFLAGLGALSLAGCGFTPVHAPGGAGEAVRGQFLVAPPRDREQFSFSNRVEDKIGRNEAAPLALAYRIATRADSVAITADQEIQRYNLEGFVEYEVIDRASEEVLSSGTVRNFTSYSATGTTVATLAAERDAYGRLMVILADQLVTRLYASAGSFGVERAEGEGA